MQILPVTMQETVYGNCTGKIIISLSLKLLNSVSSMGVALLNQAQKHFQQLLLMEDRAFIARITRLAACVLYLRLVDAIAA